MKKVLIMGAAIEQLPAIRKARELGFRVGVIDYNPSAIGIKDADDYFNVSTVDIEGVYETAKYYKPDGIITLATDMPMLAVANASTKLGLPGINLDTAIKATDKVKMIRAFKEAHLASPWFYGVYEEAELHSIKKQLLYPCIMKPIDNAASRGVVFINSDKDLESAYIYSRANSLKGAVIIEEFMKGREVSVEIIVIDGIAYVLQITDKITSSIPHFVELGHNQPSRLAECDQTAIKEIAVKAVEAIGIKIGPAHVEIMLTKEGPKLIELGARLGGDCITSHLVCLSTGIDMLAQTIKLLTGEKPDITPKYNRGAAIRFISDCKGRLKRVAGLENIEKIEGVIEAAMIMNPGDNLGDRLASSDNRIAYVITQGDNAEKAINLAETAVKQLSVIKE